MLALCLVDPCAVRNLKFSTIRDLSSLLVDFLVLIPSHMDANRNQARLLPEVRLSAARRVSRWEGLARDMARGQIERASAVVCHVHRRAVCTIDGVPWFPARRSGGRGAGERPRSTALLPPAVQPQSARQGVLAQGRSFERRSTSLALGIGGVATPMANQSSQIVQKLWSYCNVLRDDGLSYGDYVEQLTFLLFLKMAHERTQPPWNQKSPVPEGHDWPSLLAKDGDALEAHYRHTLEGLGRRPGMLGVIFRKAQNKIQDPAKLRRLVADLIDREEWSSLDADVKGDAYEGLLEKNAQDTKGGAGQYFTPRALIRAIVDVIQPELRPARSHAPGHARAGRDRGAGQRALRGRGGGCDPAPAPARLRGAHAATPSDRDLLRAGREGERPLLRPQARERDAVDAQALDLRPADEPALHAEDEAPPAFRPRRVRGLLPPRGAGGARADLVGREPARALALLRVRGARPAGQVQPRRLLGSRTRVWKRPTACWSPI